MSETALAYIEQRGNAAGMARSLRIHPQTARYRIARLREIYGNDLDDPGERLALELSLRAGAPARVA
jgi:DNA-binding PucR family transcriptional regulator